MTSLNYRSVSGQTYLPTNDKPRVNYCQLSDTLMTISHYTSKNRFLTCDVSDELIEICCKHILTLASFVAQKKLRAYDDGNSTFTSVENNNNAV